MARQAAHAGSWYSDDAEELNEELEAWLKASGLEKKPEARAVIAPHAGYRYSGRCAAFAFANIDPKVISRVFILGPSHHHYTRKCALSRTTVYKTPIGDLPIDLEGNFEGFTTILFESSLHEVYKELREAGEFEEMRLDVDEAEHSMEMHLPYLAKVFNGAPVKIVPILVGALSSESEASYGRVLAKYLDDPSNFFSVSSDFCHWGSRFGYTYYDKKRGQIYKSIEALDRSGMDIIETKDPEAFKEYLEEYENTICGRHPIGVLLNMIQNCSSKLELRFLQYEQSSHCKSPRDSSVSYASAVVTVAC